ncbi:PEP/pyruvate-binding domain-containing protein [Actinopolymorpha pittospori]|uniref:PEP/pyruvate-binding domain-containing protein n=1 Tax=Actinopolymorpha pittospori TaxID=648752 RepID=UPI00192DB528|nr:PEP/pyruvate-binding domain-containing protein [Actinopolymorpha pittospori]
MPACCSPPTRSPARGASVVDAAPGLGTAVVDGAVTPDHYVLDGTDPEERAVRAGSLEAAHRTGSGVPSASRSPPRSPAGRGAGTGMRPQDPK